MSLKKPPKSKIEIEFRSLLSKAQYKKLREFLRENAKDLGEDNQDGYYFLLPDKVVKIANNVSKKTAKIVIKFNRLSRGSSDFEEIEIPIDPPDFKNAVKLFSALPFDQIQNSYQKRRNYRYKGVDLALKYTKSWLHHMELEIMIDDKSKKGEAEQKIKKVAKELGVKIMSKRELVDFAKKIDKQYKK